MRNILFDILITEDDYIEIDNIIAKTKEILGIPSSFCNLLYFSHHVISYLFNFIYSLCLFLFFLFSSTLHDESMYESIERPASISYATRGSV